MTPHTGTALVTGASSGSARPMPIIWPPEATTSSSLPVTPARLRAAAERIGQADRRGRRVPARRPDATSGPRNGPASRPPRRAPRAPRELRRARASRAVARQSADFYDGMLDLNVRALQTLTFAAATKGLRRPRRGAIVNVSSSWPSSRSASTPATPPEGLRAALTQGLAAEIGGKGVQLQAVLPGSHPHRVLRQGRRGYRADPRGDDHGSPRPRGGGPLPGSTRARL